MSVSICFIGFESLGNEDKENIHIEFENRGGNTFLLESI